MNLLSPNPAKGYILLQYFAPINMETMIKIMNHEMRQVKCLVTNFIEGSNHTVVNVEGLDPGNYVVQIFFREDLLEQMIFNKN